MHIVTTKELPFPCFILEKEDLLDVLTEQTSIGFFIDTCYTNLFFLATLFLFIGIVLQQKKQTYAKIAALADAICQLKLDVKETKTVMLTVIGNLNTEIETCVDKITTETNTISENNKETNAVILDKISQLVVETEKQFDALNNAIALLPPVMGKKYSKVWNGVTDMFERILHAQIDETDAFLCKESKVEI